MMRNSIRCLLPAILLIAILPQLLTAETPNAVAITCDLMERVTGGEWQTVDSRSYLPAFDREFQFSLGSVSYSLKPSRVNDSTVAATSHLTSFDFTQKNYFGRHEITVGAAIFFDSVVVRENSLYRVRLRVDSMTSVTPDCDFTFTGDDFHQDPSGDFDFYFIPGALGDYHWNEIRDVMEQNYDAIRQRIDLYEPTKVNFFISPCQVPDVGWDDRWQNALDLSRNNLFVHYTHGINTLHVETVFMLKLQRLWGYSPAVVVEGAASLVELCDMYAQDYLREGTLPRISDLGVSGDYRALPRETAAYSAGSFVKYLIITRGISQFESFYRRVSDLTFAETFESVYNEPITKVEQDWNQFLDTLRLSAEAFASYRFRAETLMRYEQAVLFLDRELGISGDTVHLGPKLANYYYYFGEYEGAEKVFRAVLRDPEAQPIAKSYLANLLLMQGKVDEAEKYYLEALAEDTTDSYQPELKLGLIEQYRGDQREAIDLLLRSRAKSESVPIRVDIDIALGDSYYELGKLDSARVLYQGALDTAKILLGSFNDKPLYRLRIGRAAVRLGEGANALDHLKTEFFIEDRIYYIGQILLAMGQAYDLLGDRKSAEKEYREIFLHPTGWLEREAADKYMRQPFFRP